MQIKYIRKDGVKFARFNCNIPEDHFTRLHQLAESMEISMTKLIERFIDNFDKIIKFDENDYKDTNTKAD